MAIGLGVVILFYLMENNLIANGIIRKRILARLSDNKSRGLGLLQELEQLVQHNNAWAATAFTGSDITYGEYIEILREKYDIEYADSEFEKLRGRRLAPRDIRDYYEKISSQEEAIGAFGADVAHRKTNLLTGMSLQAS